MYYSNDSSGNFLVGSTMCEYVYNNSKTDNSPFTQIILIMTKQVSLTSATAISNKHRVLYTA